MLFLKHASINRKLTLLVAASVALALLLSSATFVARDFEAMRTSTVRQLSILAEIMGSNTTAALTFDDSESAGMILSSLRTQPMIQSACVYDAAGRVFAVYSPNAEAFSFPTAPPPPGHSFTRQGGLDVSQNILADGTQIGTIYLYASLGTIYAEMVKDVLMTALSVVVAFGISYLFTRRLQRGISGPILALAKTAEQISANEDYSVRVQKASDDELGTLYDQFNRMLEQVESGKRDLQTAHRRLERQSQEKMRAIVETAADAIITFRVDGVIESCNGASANLFGMVIEDLIGGNLGELLVEARSKPWAEFLHGLLDARGSEKKGAKELHVQRTDGTRVPLLLSLSGFRTDSGRMYTAILRDLSDYHRLQRELVQAQKLESIGQLAAGIAHEINTPMQFVHDNIEFLSDSSDKLFTVVETYQRNLHESGPQRSWQDRSAEVNRVIQETRFDHIRQEIPNAIRESLEGIQRVINIVRAMKEFSHPGQEEKIGVDLNNAVKSTVTLTRNRWKYAAEMVLELDPDLPTLRCVPAEINQVLLNLIVNAADAIAEKIGENGEQKGTITVRTRRTHDEIVIEVADTGCGIPDEIRNRVFDPFFTTKEVGKGTGQGLAICYNIVVNKHQGKLDVQSVPGMGTLFTVTIPSNGGPAANRDSEEPAACQPHTESLAATQHE